MARRFVRSWFTQEIEEVFDNPAEDIAKLNAEMHEASVEAGKSWTVTGRAGSAYSTPWRSEALAVPIEQMAEFNEAAKRAGTGARYVPGTQGYAILECDSRSSRAREMKSRGVFDKDGGYSDHCGSF